MNEIPTEELENIRKYKLNLNSLSSIFTLTVTGLLFLLSILFQQFVVFNKMAKTL